MSHRYNLRSLAFKGNNISSDSLYHLFEQFSSEELRSLRLVSRTWNAEIMRKFAELHHFTLRITCRHYPAKNNYPICSSFQMFYLNNIVKGHHELARQSHDDLVETIGQVFTLAQDEFAAFVQFLLHYFTIHGLIIHWSQCVHCLLSEQEDALVRLVSASTEMTRFSFWQNDILYRPRAPFLDQLCRALAQTAVVQVDFNLFRKTNQLLEDEPLATLLPYLTRLTLGKIRLSTLARSEHLPQLGRQLTHLKLTKHFHESLDTATLRQFAQQMAAHSNITTLALEAFPTEIIALFCEHFNALTQLKLLAPEADYHHHHTQTYFYFTGDLSRPLQALPQLIDLTLINYHLMPTSPVFFALRPVTKLTLIHTSRLLEPFYTDAQRNRLDVSAFVVALSEQFPSLHQLILIGQVYQAELVRFRLPAVLPAQIQLKMIFSR